MTTTTNSATTRTASTSGQAAQASEPSPLTDFESARLDSLKQQTRDDTRRAFKETGARFIGMVRGCLDGVDDFIDSLRSSPARSLVELLPGGKGLMNSSGPLIPIDEELLIPIEKLRAQEQANQAPQPASALDVHNKR